ncbi:MAG: NUDIX hydrolase [Gemmatimonadaceae bacterium]
MNARADAREEISAGGVVVRMESTGPHFLLIRDSYRNWGFPKGHLEDGERADAAALREVSEETGLGMLTLLTELQAIDWWFRFRGRLIHKVCHFYLMRTEQAETRPQRTEGITACRWLPFEEAVRLISYDNAREVLRRAHAELGATPGAAGDAAADAASSGPAAVPTADESRDPVTDGADPADAGA